MEETRRRTVSVPVVLLLALLSASGCAGRHAAPRTLAALGGLAVGGGSVTWATGAGLGGGSGATLTMAGFVAVGVGLAAIVASGGWIALAVSCDADPDCDEEEQCREIPAPPGGVPYKQCMAH
jgi:hypothetical protein